MKMVAGLLMTVVFLSGCTSVPKGIEPISGFKLPRYLGTWYEIARLEHSFERGLNQVSAEYSHRSIKMYHLWSIQNVPPKRLFVSC